MEVDEILVKSTIHCSTSSISSPYPLFVTFENLLSGGGGGMHIYKPERHFLCDPSIVL